MQRKLLTLRKTCDTGRVCAARTGDKFACVLIGILRCMLPIYQIRGGSSECWHGNQSGDLFWVDPTIRCETGCRGNHGIEKYKPRFQANIAIKESFLCLQKILWKQPDALEPLLDHIPNFREWQLSCDAFVMCVPQYTDVHFSAARCCKAFPLHLPAP